MRLNTQAKINEILQANDDNRYYRSESDDYKEITDVKIKIDFTVILKRRHTEFILLLLQKLKEEVKDYSAFYKKESYTMTDETGIKLEYILLLDASEIVDIAEKYHQILEIMQFGEPFIQMQNIKLLFSKTGIINYDKTHKNLVAYIFDHSAYFQTIYLKKWSVAFNYRDYLINQMNLSQPDVIINYLKTNEIEINFLKPKITMAELKNILLGLCYELFSVHFTWGTKRRLRPLATSRCFYQNLERDKVIKDNVIS